MRVMRIALWGPFFVAALLVGAYIYLHDPFARDGTELIQVPLSEEDPSLDRVGDLKYLGGLDIPRMDSNIGGLSGLRWDAENGRLIALTDDARRIEITPAEESGTLTGLEKVASGMLFDRDGEWLTGKARGDSESLTRRADGGWFVSFERDHRIWTYPSHFLNRPEPTGIDPAAILGPLEDNAGIEAMAGDERDLVMCAERAATIEEPNCVRLVQGKEPQPFGVSPPAQIARRGAVPTDADVSSDGTLFILFRSYSPAQGNTAAVVAYAPDGTRREIATFLPPLTLDNFEGLAVREEGEGEQARTFLYIVSDDNFSGSQATLLMKFELIKPGQP
ncbi:esterase-like activity of phytase family protein [Erythrobacter sp. SCSIO 43205]|uniref:esterase-like activity of phytase family protein n=1 Tax=Erythrobacter sp. SCSIO 43205 TaxID=2779361 RepID=UPI001CA9CBA5|nr:esterase-like activity of phytase family protein [Erythrobacter sp. SCSIO 43205]UAB79096.1 esterase-like activity of phytase family protein [Erythrobacter sp. SCSIO 43205]